MDAAYHPVTGTLLGEFTLEINDDEVEGL